MRLTRLFGSDQFLPTLAALAAVDEVDDASVDEILSNYQSRRRSETLLEVLTANGLLVRSGKKFLTTKALSRSLLLTHALDGADLDETWERLRDLYPELDKISIVKRDMTGIFFRELFRQTYSGSIMICSPWINLTTNQRASLQSLVMMSRTAGEAVNVDIITRDPKSDKREALPLTSTLEFLASIGANISIVPAVHAKVYIRTPSSSGGDEFAIVGSQNLTIPKYLELGLFIRNDSRLVRRLAGAFYGIAEEA